MSRYKLQLVLWSLIAAFLVGCGESTAPNTTTTPAPATSETPSAATPTPPESSTAASVDNTPPAVESSDELKLAQRSGCLMCHQIDKKVIGPAWRDVAKRYRDDPTAETKLIAKVVEGGKGNWTDVTGGAAMPPYGTRVAPEDIAKLVRFVLSLK